MPARFDILLFIIQLVIIAILFGIIIWLMRQTQSIRFEKRIGRYAIDAIHENSTSFFEYLYHLYVKVRSRLTAFLKKIHIFDNYSLKYEKYIDGSKKIREQPMDYISVKILTSLLVLVIIIFSDVLQYKSIAFYQIAYSLLAGFFIPDLFLISRNHYRKKQIENDLLKAIIIMNNAFKSGRSMMQALDIVSEELDGPIKDEFRKMYIDLTFGLSLETVFHRFAKRVNVSEVKYITTSLTILNQTGGNIVKVFSSIERSFFNRRKLQQELKSLTASADAIFKILVFIPVFMVVLIASLNPGYFLPLFQSAIGILLFIIMLVLYITYIFIIKKVMKIKED